MSRYIILFIALLFTLPAFNLSAETLTSNGTGGGLWDDPDSWENGKTPDDLNNGDTLVIQAGDIITLIGTANFNGVIQIYGGLHLNNGKLSMNITSVIQLAEGSSISAENSGENESISIGPTNRITSDFINTLVTPNELTADNLEDGGCAAVATCDFIPLPVKVIYFQATELDNAVKLNWATSFEENFDYFTLERSSDGRSFTEYTRIFSKTDYSTQVKTYSYTDEMPFPGRSYYRLKSTDFDGTSDYHGVVSTNLEDLEPDILIYANPSVRGQVTVSFNGDRNSTFRVLDITGKIIEDGLLQPGLNYLRIPPPFQRSIYFFQVDGWYSSIVKKFIIL